MSVPGTLLKIVALGLLDAVGVYAVVTLLMLGAWPAAIVVGLTTLLLNWIYLGRRAVPAKYLAPGLVLLVAFNLFVVVYTGYISVTNNGIGHLVTKPDAIAALETQNRERDPESPGYPLTVLDRDGAIAFLVTLPDGSAAVGDATTSLTPVPDATFDEAGAATGMPGTTTLRFGDIMARQREVLSLAVAVSDDPADGFLVTQDGRTAYVYRAVLVYDAAQDAMVHQVDGRTYPDNGRGAFERAGEPPLQPGWTAVIGLDNYATAILDSVRNPQIVGVFTWTFVFAFLAVLTTFALGTFLALVFNDPRIRGRRLYRVIMLLPYGFPAFMSILVWGGMFNPSYGFINDTLLGGARIPWLDDPVMAKVSLLLVNLWLDFPYFFLVATGALQSIPAELEEAAVLDGASRWALFRRIRFPLMLVSLAPLLIASFAFAINNYTLVWLLTQGQPVPLGSMNGVGETDILITMVYKIAFGAGDLTGGSGQNADYGLASAYATVIFVIVGLIAAWSFRRTRKLEEVF